MSALESRVQKKIEVRGMHKKICAKRDRFEKLAEIMEESSRGRFRQNFLTHLKADRTSNVKDCLMNLYDANK